MLNISGNAKLLLYQKPIKMNKSFEGLSVAVEEAFPGELLSGSCFIFINRLGDHMKVLYWDGDGLAIWYKRLEKGTFARHENKTPLLSRKEFLMMLEGVVPKRIQSRFSL